MHSLRVDAFLQLKITFAFEPNKEQDPEMATRSAAETSLICAKLSRLEAITRTTSAVLGLRTYLDAGFVSHVQSLNNELLCVISDVKSKMATQATTDTLIAILSANMAKGERLKAMVAAHMDAAGVSCLR